MQVLLSQKLTLGQKGLPLVIKGSLLVTWWINTSSRLCLCLSSLSEESVVQGKTDNLAAWYLLFKLTLQLPTQMVHTL